MCHQVMTANVPSNPCVAVSCQALNQLFIKHFVKYLVCYEAGGCFDPPEFWSRGTLLDHRNAFEPAQVTPMRHELADCRSVVDFPSPHPIGRFSDYTSNLSVICFNGYEHCGVDPRVSGQVFFLQRPSGSSRSGHELLIPSQMSAAAGAQVVSLPTFRRFFCPLCDLHPKRDCPRCRASPPIQQVAPCGRCLLQKRSNPEALLPSGRADEGGGTALYAA